MFLKGRSGENGNGSQETERGFWSEKTNEKKTSFILYTVVAIREIQNHNRSPIFQQFGPFSMAKSF
jgi:hypothetical protein